MTPWLAVAAGFVLLAAAPQPFGPSRSYSGVYSSSFEQSEFGGCWLSFVPAASKKFFSLVPPETHWGRRYRIDFTGRSTPRLKSVGRGQGYGHLGMFPCEIEVTEIRSARILRPEAR